MSLSRGATAKEVEFHLPLRSPQGCDSRVRLTWVANEITAWPLACLHFSSSSYLVRFTRLTFITSINAWIFSQFFPFSTPVNTVIEARCGKVTVQTHIALNSQNEPASQQATHWTLSSFQTAGSENQGPRAGRHSLLHAQLPACHGPAAGHVGNVPERGRWVMAGFTASDSRSVKQLNS